MRQVQCRKEAYNYCKRQKDTTFLVFNNTCVLSRWCYLSLEKGAHFIKHVQFKTIKTKVALMPQGDVSETSPQVIFKRFFYSIDVNKFLTAAQCLLTNITESP